ncbi:hypothetical protein ABPG75_006713 [Micractinium tetrahymenae]
MAQHNLDRDTRVLIQHQFLGAVTGSGGTLLSRLRTTWEQLAAVLPGTTWQAAWRQAMHQLLQQEAEAAAAAAQAGGQAGASWWQRQPVGTSWWQWQPEEIATAAA